MRTRIVVLGMVAAFTAGVSLAASACSTTAPQPFGQPLIDASPSDATTRNTADTGRGDRADTGEPIPEAGRPEAGPVGKCTPLQGPECDLVLQDCARPDQQCVARAGPDGGIVPACVQVSGSQSSPKGSPCCVGAAGDPCLKGLTCVGGDRCPDAGEPPGRCSPICCSGDDAVCGSDLAGVPGRCNLMIVGGAPQRDLYQVCSYATVCRPLGVQPCSAGHACFVSDTSGSARCSRIFAPDGGSGAAYNQPCVAANACADGLACLSTGDAGTVCEWLCHVPGIPTPFDAGALQATPGRGGCPASTVCRPVPNLYPSWLGVCD